MNKKGKKLLPNAVTKSELVSMYLKNKMSEATIKKAVNTIIEAKIKELEKCEYTIGMHTVPPDILEEFVAIYGLPVGFYIEDD
ncbi:hypothetical protein [Flavobacterium geliluteum]|uniref:Uncharacterized protein n=1 Tax=Flavobacterium geliluteum TaxID=2816120 RepID=A0A940XG94_9FLAO|nr:hypothetical protein [Flavobacterium geliluteum]MBP4139184.1 hypothetical protein [Flavobacterium geliluteum]